MMDEKTEMVRTFAIVQIKRIEQIRDLLGSAYIGGPAEGYHGAIRGTLKEYAAYLRQVLKEIGE